MSDVHVPHLDEAHDAPPVESGGKGAHRSKSAIKIGLEVLLISTGVFLGLMGEQWREHVQHREQAENALRNFRTEILANRAAVARVKDYHAAKHKELSAFFASDGPKTAKTFTVRFNGLGPVFFERTAWDLAVATGSLNYIDPKLAFALSRVYTGQQALAELTHSIMQSVIYGRSQTADFEGYWLSVMYYFADVEIMEPALTSQYDEVFR